MNEIPFKTYLVGGAVRDQLLGRPVKERDWVVVGATPEALRALGFQQVGKHFPVFLHPNTKEEYALARKEIKVAAGYQGFNFDTAPTISLIEDLKRRDLTINAIARDDNGEFIDPFHGQADLKKRLLRHVSDAFKEDPVRILRIARFAARFPDFTVAPETVTLMREMVNNGEVDALVPDRVWKEWERALLETAPQQFYGVLHDCGALAKVLPELATSLSAPYEKSPLYQCTAAVKEIKIAAIRFATLMHLLIPEAFQRLSSRLPLPREFIALTQLVHRHWATLQSPTPLSAEDLLEILQQTDAFRRSERFLDFLNVIRSVEKYKMALGENNPELSHHLKQIEKAFDATRDLDTQTVIKKTMSGEAIAKAIYKARLEAIRGVVG